MQQGSPLGGPLGQARVPGRSSEAGRHFALHSGHGGLGFGLGDWGLLQSLQVAETLWSSRILTSAHSPLGIYSGVRSAQFQGPWRSSSF